MLAQAGEQLSTAGSRVPRVTAESLTGIGGEVQEYLEAVRMASRVLAEGAASAGHASDVTLHASTDLDRMLTAAVHLGTGEPAGAPGRLPA